MTDCLVWKDSIGPYFQVEELKRQNNKTERLLQSQRSGKLYACVDYRVTHMHRRSQAALTKEVHIYSQLQCSALPRLRRSVQTANDGGSKTISFVFEHKGGNTLKESAQSLSERDIKKIIKTVFKALGQLQKVQIAHNNINSESITINSGKVMLSLPYFSSIERTNRRGGLFMNSSASNEISFHERYGKDSDIWDFGLLILELFVKKNRKEIQQCVQSRCKLQQMISLIKDKGIKLCLIKIFNEKVFQICELQKIIQRNSDKTLKITQNKEMIRQILKLKLVYSPQVNHRDSQSNQIIKKTNKQSKVLSLDHGLDLQIQSSATHIYFFVNLKDKTAFAIIDQALLPYPLCHYFDSIPEIYDAFVNPNITRIDLREDFTLSISIDYEYSLELNRTLQENHNKKTAILNDFPMNCIGSIVNKDNLKVFKGVMISHNTMFTTASSVFDRTTKKLRKKSTIALPSADMKFKNVPFYDYLISFPKEYQTCEQADIGRHNYAFLCVSNEFKVEEDEHVDVIYDFSRQSFELNEFSQGTAMKFKYLFNGHSFEQSDIQINEGRAWSEYFIGKQVGSPLFVQFQSGRTLVIGILQQSGSILFFTKDIITDFYTWNDRANESEHWKLYKNTDELELMAFSPTHVDWQTKQEKIILQQYRRSEFFKLKNRSLRIKALLQAEKYGWAAAEYLIRAASLPECNYTRRISNLKRAELLLEYQYGKDYSRLIAVRYKISIYLFEGQLYAESREYFVKMLQLINRYECSPIRKAVAIYYEVIIRYELEDYVLEEESLFQSAASQFSKYNQGYWLIRAYSEYSVGLLKCFMKYEAINYSQKVLKLMDRYQANPYMFEYKEKAFKCLVKFGKYFDAVKHLEKSFIVANSASLEQYYLKDSLNIHTTKLLRNLINELSRQPVISEWILGRLQDLVVRFRPKMHALLNKLYIKQLTKQTPDD